MWSIIEAEVINGLNLLPADSIQCCVTSPPYYRVRSYGHPDQIGMEDTPFFYVERMVSVFDEVRRVLKPDGTFWLNIGTTYAGSSKGPGRAGTIQGHTKAWKEDNVPASRPSGTIKTKEDMLIPYRLAIALSDAGWYVRSTIVWHKPSPMPESVTDRPTKSHEYVFLLTKQPRYSYNMDAVRTPLKEFVMDTEDERVGANLRDVWTISTERADLAHTATYPVKLAERCILAGSYPGDWVLDPFVGSGTTVLTALRHGRNGLGIELSPEYVQIARNRVLWDAPLLNSGSEVHGEALLSVLQGIDVPQDEGVYTASRGFREEDRDYPLAFPL